MRLTSFFLQLLGIGSQILYHWWFITYDYENLDNRNCLFCLDPLDCQADFESNFKFSKYEDIVFNHTSTYYNVTEYAHRGIPGETCMIIQSVALLVIASPYLLYQIHYIMVAKNLHQLEQFKTEITNAKVSDLAT